MVERRTTYIKPQSPSELAPFSDELLAAVKALNAGLADSVQQTSVLKWIIYTLAGTYELGYFPDNARDTDFAAGKRWVGLQIAGLINFRPAKEAMK